MHLIPVCTMWTVSDTDYDVPLLMFMYSRGQK